MKSFAAALAVVSMLATATATAAHAQPFGGSAYRGTEEAPLWSQANYWQVRTDPSMGGCFMQAIYNHSTLVRFGIKHEPGKVVVGYLMLYNPQWSSLVPGQAYAAQISFDHVPGFSGWATWTGFAHKMGTSETVALEFDFENTNIWKGVMFGSTFHLAYEGRPVINGNLPGSADAAVSLVACQKAFNAASVGGPAGPAGSADPFVGGDRL